MSILIAGLSTRAIAESARAAGYDFITLDYFGDYDQKSWCENYSLRHDFNLPYSADKLYEASRRLSFDAVVYTSSLENHPEIVAQFARGSKAGQKTPVLGNSAEVLTRVRDWPTFFGFLRQRGFAVPETIHQGQRPPRDVQRRWLRKPIRSGGGHNIVFWPANRPPGDGFFLQEYIPGMTCSASFVANGQQCVVLGLTEQLIGRPEFGARDFAYCGNILPLAADESLIDEKIAYRSAGSRSRGRARQPGSGPVGKPARNVKKAAVLTQIQQIVADLTHEFGLVGVNGLDFILKGGQVYPLEINPRYSASMELIERVYGLSIFDLHVRATRYAELPEFHLLPHLTDRHFYGKAILYAARNGQAPDTQGWSERGVRDVPFPHEALVRDHPVCTVSANSTTHTACFAELVTQVEAIKGEIYG